MANLMSWSTAPGADPGFMGFASRNDYLADWTKRENARRANLRAMDDAAKQRSVDNAAEAFDIARGGVASLQNDANDAMVLDALRKAAQPGAGPYDATTRNAMFTAQAEAAGAGADAANQAIMEDAARRGMSPDDPGVRAALARVQSQQGAAGQRARLGIDLEANRANYDAQQSAVNRLGAFNTGKQQQIQSAQDRLRDMLMSETPAGDRQWTQQARTGRAGAPAASYAPGQPAAQPQQSVQQRSNQAIVPGRQPVQPMPVRK